MTLHQALLILSLGFLGGSYGTIVGIGGGILFVPFLLLFFHVSAQQAVGTSLTVIFFSALSGSLAYLRQRRVDLRSGLSFAAAILPGTLIGTWLSRYLDTTTLSLIVSFLLIGISLFMFFYPYRNRDKEANKGTRGIKTDVGLILNYNPRVRLGVLFSFIIGITYGLLGVGGGIILMPLMVFVLNFPPHIATATSIFILVISAFFGAAFHLILGDLLLLPALVMALGAVAGAQFGAILSRRIRERGITRLLAIAMTLLGLWMLFRVL